MSREADLLAMGVGGRRPGKAAAAEALVALTGLWWGVSWGQAPTRPHWCGKPGQGPVQGVRPPGAEPLGAAAVATLVALCRVCDRDGRATVRSVAAERGHHSMNTTQEQLRQLDRAGLVGLGVPGGLRPLVQRVADGTRPRA